MYVSEDKTWFLLVLQMARVNSKHVVINDTQK
jgi:hypothetical protein